MLKVIVVVLERRTRVVRWVNENAFDLPCVVGKQGLQGFEVVAFDDEVRAVITVAFTLDWLKKTVRNPCRGCNTFVPVIPFKPRRSVPNEQ